MPRKRGGRRRVVVFSASFGGAHRSAGDALVAYLRGRRAADVEVQGIDFLERFAPSLGVLARFAYQQSPGFFPAFNGSLADAATALSDDAVVQELASGVMVRVREYFAENEPDAVISTFDLAAAASAEAKADRQFLSAMVYPGFSVNRAWHHPATDLSFVPLKETRDDLVVHGVPWERIVVSGTPVGARFEEQVTRAAARRESGLPERFTVVLARPTGLLGEGTELVGQLAAMGVNVLVLAGHDARLSRRVTALAGGSDAVRVIGPGEEAGRAMRAGDVVVCEFAEATAAESFAVGVPVIIYNPVPAAEIDSVDFVVNAGAGLLARDAHDVVGKIRYLAGHPERLAQLAGSVTPLVRRGAAQSVCERVLAAV